MHRRSEVERLGAQEAIQPLVIGRAVDGELIQPVAEVSGRLADQVGFTHAFVAPKLDYCEMVLSDALQCVEAQVSGLFPR